MKRLPLILALLMLLPSVPAPAHPAAGVHGFVPRPIVFPADAAMHPSAGTEWWYFVGHLADAAGRTYGVEVTFFKFSGLQRYFPATPDDTAFRTDVAITDESARRYYSNVTFVPAQPPRTIAGTRDLRLRAGAIDITTVGPWRYRLRGSLPRGSIDLTVASRRPPMLVDGGSLPWGIGYTYYYSLTHMSAEGMLTIAGRRIPVRGIVWNDHQWGNWDVTSLLSWDWMGVQLDDHTDLSLTNQRVTGVAGLVQWAMAQLPDSRQVFVRRASITPLGTWRSPITGAVYPSGWRVRVPPLRLDVVVMPTVRDQEMVDNFAVMGYRASYWEGSCTVTGTRAGHRVSGKAYAELTGYDVPPQALQLQ